MHATLHFACQIKTDPFIHSYHAIQNLETSDHRGSAPASDGRLFDRRRSQAYRAGQAKSAPAELLAHITRDTAEVRNAGQVTLSYADVVQNILPSVVSISTYAKKAQARGGRGGMPTNPNDLEQVPPMLREFFRDWMERQGQAA